MDINPSPTLITASRSVRWAVTAALGVLALFLVAETWKTIDAVGRVDTSSLATITVSGTGKAATAPTVATISFSVEQHAAVVKDAQDAATTQTNKALDAVKKLGVEDKDIQTSGYSVNPQYEIPPCAPGSYCPANTGKITGYTVTQSVTVKVRDTAKAGDVLGALGTAGVQNVSGPNFTVDDDTAVQAEARGKAIADARQKAQTLANQLGVHLGKVVGFSENGGYPTPYFAKAQALDSAAGNAVASPTIPVGQNETNVSVTVVYEIK